MLTDMQAIRTIGFGVNEVSPEAQGFYQERTWRRFEPGAGVEDIAISRWTDLQNSVRQTHLAWSRHGIRRSLPHRCPTGAPTRARR